MTGTVCPSLLAVAGQQALLNLVRQPALLAFDFDGTLAPLSEAPCAVYVSPPLAAALAHISQRYPVAVISGRQLDDLVPRLGFQPTIVAGNHGAERPGDLAGQTRWERALDPARAILARYRAFLERAAIRVEDKRQSLALHFLGQPVPSAHVETFGALTSELDAVARVFGGHRVVNVTPPAAPNKGDVIAETVRALGVAAALYIGDDLTDEDVFSSAPSHWVTARVRPPATGTAAHFRLDTQHEVVSVIAGLTRLIDAASHV
jgi:trehalose 6-phosphate phosphatase